MKITGGRAVELIRDSANWNSPGVEVYWFEVDSRTTFCREVEDARKELPIVPLAVSRGFTDGNTLGDDLVTLILENHKSFANVSGTVESRIVLALVSREPMRVPQISSPLELPSWFPGFGGKQLFVEIKDYKRKLSASLKSPEARLPRLHSLMHALDVQMLRLLEDDREALDRVLQFVHRPGDGKKEVRDADPAKLGDFRAEFLKSWKETLGAVTEPSGYRLEMRKEATLAARLVGFAGRTPPDSLGKIASVLAASLGLGSDVPRPLQGLLLRPVSLEQQPDRVAGRQLLALIYTVHQFTTAAAHADQYPTYPVALLQAVSEELASSLGTLVEQLESRSPSTQGAPQPQT